jgi:hypothetical protein
MLVKVHNSYRTVVAICDTELIGKKFEQGNQEIEVKESFFKGEEKTPEETLKIIEVEAAEDATFNLVGKEAVTIALKAGIIKQEGIKKIQNIPVALALL